MIWDPLTGLGRHFDHEQWLQFVQAHLPERRTGLITVATVDLPGNRTLRFQFAPGAGMPKCGPTFDTYFDVLDSSQHIVRSFYVASKIDPPFPKNYHVCIEGGGYFDIKTNVAIDFDVGVTIFDALSDGTLLFVHQGRNAATIVRLDKNIQQHTSVGDRMFVLDAADINAKLAPSPDVENPVFRYKVFLGAIEAAKRSGLR